MSRHEVATFLREFVDEMEDGSANVATADSGDRRTDTDSGRRDEPAGAGRQRDDAGGADQTMNDPDRTTPDDASQITFVVGGESATVTIPETVDFDVEVESRSPLLKSGVNQEVEFHLSWELEEQRGDDSIDMK